MTPDMSLQAYIVWNARITVKLPHAAPFTFTEEHEPSQHKAWLLLTNDHHS